MPQKLCLGSAFLTGGGGAVRYFDVHLRVHGFRKYPLNAFCILMKNTPQTRYLGKNQPPKQVCKHAF